MELKTEPLNDEYATPLLSKDWSENPGKPLSSSSSQASSFQDPKRTHNRVLDPQQQQQLLLNPGQSITSQKSPLHNSDSDTSFSSNLSSSSISSHNFDSKLPKMTVSETPPEAITSTSANGTNGSEHKDPSNGTSALLCKSSASARQIYQGPEFPVGPLELSALAEEHGHTRGAIASLLLDGAKFHKSDGYTDRAYVLEKCAERLSDDEEKKGAVDMDEAAELLARDLLYTDPIKGIDTTGSGGGDSGDHHIEYRKHVFGTNAIAAKEFDSFLKLCWDALQDFVLIMLIVLGVISIVVETTIGNEADHCTTCWIEGAAILTSVCIVTLVTAGIDYAKQGAFARLSQALNDRNMKLVTRNGKQIEVIDADIVVGDILNVNSHNLASIPADCILLGPASEPLKMNESSLTGESVPVSKLPGDVILSGTNAVEGSGRMVVIAVGTSSVAGKIKARVYADGAGDELDADEDSPLTQKLELIAKHIGIIGTVAAVVAFGASTILGLAVEGEDVENLVDYFIVAITVLAVAVPEGLPLAVTLALAFSSNKMMSEQNLVKHLESCETMGCATTICTDKTGTLTANRMTARAVYTDQQDFSPTEASQTLGDHVNARGLAKESISLIAKCISIDTMNETTLNEVDSSGNVNGGIGNPTEVALLTFVHELGYSYTSIRDSTPGRSTSAQLKEQLSRGKQLNFSSARKMMSWVVPKTGGGYRVYTKGASEVILERCNSVHLSFVSDSFEESVLGIRGAIEAYARRGMRTLALAYRELPEGADLEAVSSSVSNSDGTPALKVETELTFLALIGIEDPLRPEVPPAIEKCYKAGIDVRMVTGDSPNTAVSIAYQAGILRDEHFIADERVAENLRENVLMEGKDFRSKVYRTTSDGLKEFDQGAFDKIWPHLRVLARSSPDDKLTLAHGLNQSTLYEDKSKCKELKRDFDIRIFPDRQVVAMTGDGTNDAPALKRADIGFAMGIAGTQIAKDAADIILLDDNFASIVVAAKWGRNIYASIQKFLQFQLTVNIAAVVTALVGAFAYQQSPLAAIQLLWVNLIMDALASLALASEKPIDSLLEADPVNRSDSMITERMWFNMIGQAGYQLIVTMILLFEGPDIWGYEAGDIVEQDDSKYDDYVGEPSEHYTMIFNTFVWMQLFNEINSRHLHGEINVFKGLSSNSLFIGIWVGTAALQVLMISFFSHAMRVKEGGLPADIWGWCLLFGVGSIPMQQLINAVYSITRNYGPLRKRRKQQSIRDVSVRSIP